MIEQVDGTTLRLNSPGLSTHEPAKNGSTLAYDETEGHAINKETGHRNRFIAAAGTYFMQLVLPKNVFAADLNIKDFGRPGP